MKNILCIELSVKPRIIENSKYNFNVISFSQKEHIMKTSGNPTGVPKEKKRKTIAAPSINKQHETLVSNQRKCASVAPQTSDVTDVIDEPMLLDDTIDLTFE